MKLSQARREGTRCERYKPEEMRYARDLTVLFNALQATEVANIEVSIKKLGHTTRKC